MAPATARPSGPVVPPSSRRVVVASLLASGAFALSRPARLAAQSHRLTPSAAAIDSAGIAAHHRLVWTLMTGDSASALRMWCADYQGVATDGSTSGRAMVLRRLSREQPVWRQLRPPEGMRLRVTAVSDSQVVASAEYRLGYDVLGHAYEQPIGMTHEFRRRPSGWCAYRGRAEFLRHDQAVKGEP